MSEGGSATLLWNVTGAASIDIDNGIGQVEAAGTKVVSPSTTTVYNLTAKNATASVSKSAVVIIMKTVPTSPTTPTQHTSPSTVPPSVTPLSVDVWTNVGGQGPNTPGGTLKVGDELIVYLSCSSSCQAFLSLNGPYTLTQNLGTVGAGTYQLSFGLAENKDIGVWNATLEANANGQQASDITTFTVVASTTTCGITPPGILQATVGQPFTYQFLVTGCHCPPNDWTVTGLPWLSMDSNTGVISGTPTQAGTFSFHVSCAEPVCCSPTGINCTAIISLELDCQIQCTSQNPSANCWCCRPLGVISHTTQSQCSQWDGRCYDTEAEADQACQAQSLADLVITTGNPKVAPSIVDAGSNVRLSPWIVKNQGNAVSGYFIIGLYLSADSVITAGDTYLDSFTAQSRAPGASQYFGGADLTIPAGTPPGNYYIGILVDTTNMVTESNKNNNYVASPITVAPGH
jgi:hypothetical protein